MPSYIEMCKFALNDTAVRLNYEKQRLEKVRTEFMQENGLQVEDNTHEINTEDYEWRTSKLKRSSSTGVIERTINNALVILENDEMLKNKLIYDRFSNRFLIRENMPWRQKG